MQIDVLPDGEAASLRGAKVIAAAARASVAARGRFLVAVSGGKNPWKMFRALTQEDVPWEKVEIIQVDERVAPDGDPDRNLTHLRECLLGHARRCVRSRFTPCPSPIPISKRPRDAMPD